MRQLYLSLTNNSTDLFKPLGPGTIISNADLTKLYFAPLEEDPGMYYGQGIIMVTYVNDTLFFGPNMKQTEKVISELEGLVYGPTR